MIKYLITGGAGFIGSHLADELINANHHVTVLDDLSNGLLENVPSGAEFVEGNILDAKLLDKLMINTDVCFHLAAIPSVSESTKHWVNIHKINATGTINVLNAVRPDKLKRQIPVIFSSSCAVYGASIGKKLKETSKTMPISPYGADKLSSELHAYVAFQQFKIPTLCLRIFNVYGTRQNSYSSVIAVFLNNLKNNSAVTSFGDGEQSRDFIYVKDVVNCLIKASQLDHQSALVINACTGNATTINNLIKILTKKMQKEIEVNYEAPRSDDVYYSCGDPALAKQILNFQSKYNLEEGLEQLIKLQQGFVS